MLKNSFSVKNITLIHYMEDEPETVYKNYQQLRGVCGIIVALSGCAEYLFSDGRRRLLNEGEIALFSDKTAYIVKNNSNSPFKHYTINFCLNFSEELPANEIYLKTCDIKNIAYLCNEILKNHTSPSPYSEILSMAYLYMLLAKILEDPHTEFYKSNELNTIAPAIRIIETEFSQDLNIDTLANICMMSNTNFRRVFKRVSGISPIEYLINTRIKEAENLIIHTKLPILEIALKCGFKNPEHFCRTFKKRKGETAHQFRKRIFNT